MYIHIYIRIYIHRCAQLHIHRHAHILKHIHLLRNGIEAVATKCRLHIAKDVGLIVPIEAT